MELPMNLLMKRLGANNTLPIMVALWGMVCACQGAVKSYGGLLACRFFLGALEGPSLSFQYLLEQTSISTPYPLLLTTINDRWTLPRHRPLHVDVLQATRDATPVFDDVQRDVSRGCVLWIVGGCDTEYGWVEGFVWVGVDFHLGMSLSQSHSSSTSY